MFKKFAFLSTALFSSILLSGCSFKKAPAALQITTNPISNVFIDGKPLGKTPFSDSTLKEGEVNVKLIPESTSPLSSWEGKVKLNSGVLTIIDRDFGISDSNSSGQILSLEKVKDNSTSQLSVVTEPDNVLVKVDGETKGLTPLSLDKITPSDHEIILSKDNYSEKRIKARTVAGYRLVVSVKLAQATVEVTPTPTVTPSGPTPKASVTPKASKTTLTPAPTSSSISKVSPTTSPTGNLGFVTIKANSVGFLRVRNAPSGTEIAKITPIDPEKQYPLLEEKTGWYKITYEEGKDGWVTADTQYTTKVSQ